MKFIKWALHTTFPEKPEPIENLRILSAFVSTVVEGSGMVVSMRSLKDTRWAGLR
jgi:hypothetical protein